MYSSHTVSPILCSKVPSLPAGEYDPARSVSFLETVDENSLISSDQRADVFESIIGSVYILYNIEWTSRLCQYLSDDMKDESIRKQVWTIQTSHGIGHPILQ